jgi:uncharacterized protein YecA (UPF0149 family)
MKNEETIETPNEVQEAPHLTEQEIAILSKMQQMRARQQSLLQTRAEYINFCKMSKKPQKFNTPKKFDEEGDVVEHEGYSAPVSRGNLGKGTLRNKKCSCGSGKKFKLCCLNRNR